MISGSIVETSYVMSKRFGESGTSTQFRDNGIAARPALSCVFVSKLRRERAAKRAEIQGEVQKVQAT